MGNLAISLGSLIIGVVATIWVSRYYYKRSTNKALTPYLQFFSSLFDGVDPSVRESLKIAYKGTAVTELLEAQFLIANSGERPIRDIIAPMTLKLPDTCSVLDASILHVSPAGREVTILQSASSVAFAFPLLNAGDFFIAKLLLQGKAKFKDFKFTITVDDLPPVINAVHMPVELIEGEKKREFEWAALGFGLGFIILGASLASLIYLQWPTIAQSWHLGLRASFATNWLTLVSSLISAIPTLVLLVGGPMLCVGAFTDFSFPRRRRYRVPDGYHRRVFLRGIHSVEFVEDTNPDIKKRNVSADQKRG